MKHLIFAVGLVLAVAYPTYAADDAKKETKKVCVDVEGKDCKPEMEKKS